MHRREKRATDVAWTIALVASLLFAFAMFLFGVAAGGATHDDSSLSSVLQISGGALAAAALSAFAIRTAKRNEEEAMGHGKSRGATSRKFSA